MAKKSHVAQKNPGKGEIGAGVIFIYYIIPQEALCTSVLERNHIVKPGIKLINFIRASLLSVWKKLMLIIRTCFTTLVSAGQVWGKYVNECGSSNR